MPRGGKRSGAGRKPGTTGPQVRTRVVRRKLERSVDLKADDTLRRMRDGADWDPADLFDAKNNVRNVRDIPLTARKAIVGFEVLKRNLTAGDDKVDTILKVVLARDRSRYVEMLGKHHGLLVEKVKVEGEVTLMDKIAQARKRIAADRSKLDTR